MIITRDYFGRIIKSDGRPPVDIDVELAIALYSQGLSANRVADLVGTNSAVLLRRFVKLGIPRRDKGCGARGKKFGLEHRKRISEGRKRLLANPDAKERYCMGSNNPFFGRKHDPATIEAMKKKLSVLLSGENNANWQGGKSIEPYNREFFKIKKLVYKRDNHTCQSCGQKFEPNKGLYVAHHIDSDKNNASMSNLITLCRVCHGKITMAARWSKEVVQIL
jgi:hypothetical protein